MKHYITPCLILLAAACGSRPPEAARKAAPEAAALSVTTAVLAESEWPERYEATGTVRARVTGVVSSRVMAYVREVRAQTGDRVPAGQTVVILDSRDLETAQSQAEAAGREAKAAMAEVDNSMAGAKAQLGLAETTFGRMKELHEKKSVSNQEFDEAAARLEVARANVEALRSRRMQVEEKIRQAGEAVKSAQIMSGFAAISAPFTGIVVERKVEPGNLAAPGAPLLVMEQAGAYRMEAEVEESKAAVVKPGTAVEVRVEALGRNVPARVTDIVPAVDPASRTFLARIDLPGGLPLRSGMFGRALFSQGTRKVLAIPATAVVREGQLESVFVVEQNHARKRLVTTGAHTAEQVEALSGVAVGDRVILNAGGVEDGRAVEVRP